MKHFILLFQFVFFVFGAFAQTNQEKWISNEYANFVVHTPDSVQYNPQKIPTDLGEVDFHVYYVQAKMSNDPNQIYTYAYADYPAEVVHSDSTHKIKNFLDGSSEGSVKNLQGKLVAQKDITINGFPGREFEVSVQEGLIIDHFKILLVKNRFYILQVITLAEEKENERLHRFLDSFQFF